MHPVDIWPEIPDKPPNKTLSAVIMTEKIPDKTL
jgi:hypothetical protein